MIAAQRASRTRMRLTKVRKDLLPNTTAAYSNEADAGDEPPP